MFHVMSYQNSNTDLIESFTTANHALEKDGLFIFDCWFGPGVLCDKPAVRVKEVKDEEFIYIRSANPVMYADKNVVDVNYDVVVIDKTTSVATKITETHKMRYFFVPEIEMISSLAGFEMIDCIDCNTLKSVTYDTWTAYFVLRKVKGC